MTREEAIGRIQEHIHIHSKKEPFTPYLDKAFYMAVEALREMSVEEYRQRLMEVFHNTDHDELLTYVVMPKEEEFKSLEDILRQYRYEPRQHGEWIDTTGNNDFVCSVCKHKAQIGCIEYCGNCGADMRKKEGESN